MLILPIGCLGELRESEERSLRAKDVPTEFRSSTLKRSISID